MRLPGKRVPASVWRLPRRGGALHKVMDITLLAPLGILFQPEQRTLFTQSTGGYVKRHYCLADWPTGTNDPMPVHPGDTLLIPAQPIPSSTVQAAPAPTTTSFAVAAGKGASFVPYQPIDIAGIAATPEPRIDTIIGDVITLQAALPAAPAVGAVVTQPGSMFSVEDSDPWQGHHLSIYVDLVPAR